MTVKILENFNYLNANLAGAENAHIIMVAYPIDMLKWLELLFDNDCIPKLWACLKYFCCKVAVIFLFLYRSKDFSIKWITISDFNDDLIFGIELKLSHSIFNFSQINFAITSWWNLFGDNIACVLSPDLIDGFFVLIHYLIEN